jgi:hypothetical protein
LSFVINNKVPLRIRSISGICCIFFLVLYSCKHEIRPATGGHLFSILDSRHTKIDFINKLEYTEEFNTYTYRNFYNGAGVGLGDVNNDGLTDIYFCGNQSGNKLYLNKGNFVFEDITDNAGVSGSGSWSTGVVIADINGDGFQDIYVCKSGKPDTDNRSNELFINNGDLTFSEKAGEYGLNVLGLSNHATFFDFDRDGDLDCYLLNNSFQSVTTFDMKPGLREIPDSLGGNKFLRNDNGKFVDITSGAGIYSSKIGFGLGVNIGDINRDGWPDIYVSNDFFERDYLYINNKDGTFTESLEDQMTEISQGAMGADIADINNDGWPDIYATEMTPEDNARMKTKVLFDSWETYQIKVRNGFYRQFTRNVLQLNNRNGSFSEIGRYSGISTTDWSWGALIADLDNDGFKDIFVANGIYKDLLDRDFLNIYSDPSIMRSIIKTEESAILRLIEMIPSVKVPNYAFHNNGDLTFTNLSEDWGLNTPSFSNGAAYGDLDNDGDLDLVVNNVNMPPFICRNESQKRSDSNYLTVVLKGKGKNTSAIGANVTLYYNGQLNYQELIPARGFQSSVDTRLHFGLGKSDHVDSLKVNWPDGLCTSFYDIDANRFMKIIEDSSKTCLFNEVHETGNPLFRKVEIIPGLDYRHVENDYSDFERDKLLFEMLSNEGPHIATGDVNSDGLTDLFICGAKDSPGAMYIQDNKGNFRRTNEALFETDRISEDTDCAFFDADRDGDIDLYVASGGSEFPASASALLDRLYINDGSGRFTKSPQMLPVAEYICTSCIKPADYDKDGDYELFVGSRLQPFAYGLPSGGYLLENDGKGNFTDVTSSKAPSLKGIGMITDMVWEDVNKDGNPDMLIVGDWMPVKVLINKNGSFEDQSEYYGLGNTFGWWNRIFPSDLNGDGYVDFIIGNHGLNSYFKASPARPVTMYVNDFDLNGAIEQIICVYNGDKSYPLATKDDLEKQISSISNMFKTYNDYKDKTIEDIFPAEILAKSVKLKAVIMESCVMMNNRNSFTLTPLPPEAQFSPVCAVLSHDFNNDGICDLVIGGNQSRAKPQTGIFDAGYGLFLKGDTGGRFVSVGAPESGLSIRGEIRDFKIIKFGSKLILIVARNNDNLQFYEF